MMDRLLYLVRDDNMHILYLLSSLYLYTTTNHVHTSHILSKMPVLSKPALITAPTNDAFAALPEGTVDSLLLPENIDKLTEILTYHVIASEVASTDLVNGQEVETLNGESVTVNVDNDGNVISIEINDSNVITADIVACNGIIHVIDAVLIPPEDDEPAATEDPTGFPTVTVSDFVCDILYFMSIFKLIHFSSHTHIVSLSRRYSFTS